MRKAILLCLILFIGNITWGQEVDNSVDSLNIRSIRNTLAMKGSGVINYHNFRWDTDTTKRDATDAERFNLYLMHQYNDKISMKAELEFEHGGTGITKEFDKFEEAGEYETEVEAGGEVKLEQLNILFKIKPWIKIKAGRLKVYMGLASKLDEPTDYFTTTLSESENAILPLGWYENGIEFSGDVGSKRKLKYKLAIVNGLDASAFSSRNWVKNGHQVTFETPNADALAFAGRLDYYFNEKNFIGWSGYIGNSAPNRPKTDLEVDAYVGITDLHFRYEKGAIKLRGMALYGYLQNAEHVSQANRNLSNNLNVKRTPVGSGVLAYYVESAYDLSTVIKGVDKQFLAFVRYDYFDTMYKVDESIFNNGRWERTSVTGGFNYFPDPNVVIKLVYNYRILGLKTLNKERTFSMGIGFTF